MLLLRKKELFQKWVSVFSYRIYFHRYECLMIFPDFMSAGAQVSSTTHSQALDFPRSRSMWFDAILICHAWISSPIIIFKNDRVQSRQENDEIIPLISRGDKYIFNPKTWHEAITFGPAMESIWRGSVSDISCFAGHSTQSEQTFLNPSPKRSELGWKKSLPSRQTQPRLFWLISLVLPLFSKARDQPDQLFGPFFWQIRWLGIVQC